MPSPAARRLIYDISTLARWTGPAVGIARTDRELALWLRKNRSDSVFTVFDPQGQVFRPVNPSWVDRILRGDALIEFLGMPAPNPSRPRRIDRIPQGLRPAALWVLQFRRKLLAALERMRVAERRPASRARIERMQGRLMSNSNRATFFTPEGRRRAVLPNDVAVGPELVFEPTDTLVTAGTAWQHLNVDAIRRLKERVPFRFILLCYDIIPLQFPEFYRAHDVERFREHYHATFPIADRVIFSARKIEADARDYCRSNGLAIHTTAVVPLGADAPYTRSSKGVLPPNLTPGKYALFVSTIEPRKGHGLLYRVWRRLLLEGVPQAADFKLVFVGRRGWMVEELLARIDADELVRDSLVILSNVDDGELAALYDGAAFCLYPSVYEGFGLPVVEALARGKAVIASTGGSIPEVVGDFSPCLDPTDEEAWYTVFKQWIAEPAARAPYEEAIKARYRCPSWQDTAERFFRAAEA